MIEMTRKEAEKFMEAIDFSRSETVAAIKEINRKHSTQAVKIHDSAIYRKHYISMVLLQEKIGTAFNLGGY